MPILELQRRLREAGRIRIGQRVAGGRPTKLDTFRLTSSDRDVIHAAAGLYGGIPREWEGAPIGDQWEVILETDTLPVVVPPAATVLSQWYETWTGGGCVRRCDGETEVLHNQPCPCNLEDERTCKPTTRLNVILRDLPGLGVWRLESHGWYAATELAGTVEVCLAAATRGQLLPAVLRLEQRQVKRVGEPTRNFAVPVLDVSVTPTQLGVTVGGPAPEPEDAKAWRAIAAAPPDRPDPAMMAQAAIEPGRDMPLPRKNSPPPIPPTGTRPRTAAAVAAEASPPVRPVADKYKAPIVDPGVTPAQLKKLHIMFHEAGLDDRAQWLEFASLGVERPIRSTKELTAAEASVLIDSLAVPGDEPFPVGDGSELDSSDGYLADEGKLL